VSVLTATGAVRVRCLSGQSSLPWGPLLAPAPRTPARASASDMKAARAAGFVGPARNTACERVSEASLEEAHHGG
jgi:hypothetical protein